MQNFFPPTPNSVDNLIDNIANNNSQVTSAYFDNQRLSDNNVVTLCAALQHNTYLKYINLAMTNLTIPQLTSILNAIKVNKSITTLILPLAKNDPAEFKLLVEETEEHVAKNKETPSLGTSR